MCSLDVLVEAVAAPEWAEVCGVPWLSPRLAAGFVGARVGLLCSAPLGVPAGFSAACVALVVPPGQAPTHVLGHSACCNFCAATPTPACPPS